VWGRIRGFPRPRLSVREDWSAWLPLTKSNFFDSYVRQLDVAYNIFSVALNEALELRRIGRNSQSCRSIFAIPPLCSRLARPVESLLYTLGEHAKHFGTIPKSVPIDPANFRGSREQYTARKSELLSRVLLTERSLFLHKVDILEEMVFHIRQRVQETASDLATGVSLSPSSDWQSVDDAHFDLNTCLREATVLLKSFLVVLPEEQLSAFQNSVSRCVRASEASFTLHLPQRRRATPIERE
jgi:hypothetical protein